MLFPTYLPSTPVPKGRIEVGAQAALAPYRQWQLYGLAYAVLLLSGCGLPTWSELVGGKKEEQAPVVVVPPPQFAPTPAPTPPPPLPKPQPAEVIAKFKSLRPTEIDDQALEELTSLEEGLEAIDELTLHGSQVTTKGVQNLSRLTHLARLDIRGTQLEQSAFPHIGQATSIQELSVDGSRVTVEAAQSLRNLKDLKVFQAANMNLTALAWHDFLAAHPELETIAVPFGNLSDMVMPSVGKLAKLKKLVINNTSVSDLGLATIAKLDNLETLTISSCPVNGTGFMPPGGGRAFIGLKELNMTTTPLDERGAKAIKQMKELRALWLGDMPTMQDMHLQQMIRPLTNLEYINLTRNTSLTSQSMLALAGNENLREVCFAHCTRMDNLAFKHLAKCKNLKRVDVHDTSCTVQGALALKEILPDVEIVGLVE